MSEPQFSTGVTEVRPCGHCGVVCKHVRMRGMYWGHEYWMPEFLDIEPSNHIHRAPCGLLCDQIPSHAECCGVEPAQWPTEDDLAAKARDKWAKGETVFTPWSEQPRRS